MLKKGEEIICKTDYNNFFKNIKYKIVFTYFSIGSIGATKPKIMWFQIRDENNILRDFSPDGINEYFYTKQELRKMKLKQLMK